MDLKTIKKWKNYVNIVVLLNDMVKIRKFLD